MEQNEAFEQIGTVIVTGATGGIGLATAIGVAAAGGRVVLHGRSGGRCDSAVEQVRAAVPESQPETVVADLASLEAVRALGAEVVVRFPRIDALVNNAGAFTMRRKETRDGLEMQFGVNHVAHFLLALTLLPALHASPRGRVVCVSSGTHRSGRIHWNDLQQRRLYNGVAAYGQSKLANVLLAYELQRRVSAASHVISVALEPGLVNTDMGGKATGPLARLVWSRRRHHGVSPEEGAATSVYLATAKAGTVDGGTYWAKSRQATSSKASYDEEAASRLWEWTEEICGIRLEDVLRRMRG